jgi:sugar lactone lactonase YvrE
MVAQLLIATAFAGTSASSSKKDAPTILAVDGQLQTSWMEDTSGHGKDETFTLTLHKTMEIKSISIWPGNLTNGSRSFKQYARPKLIRILVNGEQVGEPIRFTDTMRRFDIELDTKGRTIEIVVDEVFEGLVYSDMAIAEVSVNFPETSEGKRMQQWIESKDGTRKTEQFVEELNDAYSSCKSADFGDKESFDKIGQAAADGSPVYQQKIRAYVPDGFRIQSLPSDPTAQKALRKLKDPNGVPYLELAALRSWGKERRLIQADAEYLLAYGDLIGGPNRNVQFWGESGWSVGAFQSFGEPLPLEVNRFGDLYIADTGNNRIQLFNVDGRSIRQWGNPEPGITNAWFAQNRPYYASGSESGRKAGQFTNPVDVTLLPEKEVDGFATLEANGRVQLFDSEGRTLISWTASPTYAPEGGLGGTAYIAYLPKRDYICTILQDEGICFNRDAEELSRWTIPDGTPNSVEVVKNDKILMAFGDKIVAYTFDGFRDRVIMDSKVLGDGFESLDMTLDEEGKLWVLTDRGDAFKFKRPGKVDFQIHAIDRGIRHPRIAVIEDILYITSDDQIEVVDIRQRKIDLEDAAKENQ